MAILRSSHKAGKTKPQAKSFNELVSRLGQRSQLAAPRYADSTKLGTAFIWGRWTKYVDSSIHGPHLSSWAGANKAGPRFCLRRVQLFHNFRSRRRVQEPSTLRSRQVVFRMELLNLKDAVVGVPLQLRKILEGRSTFPLSWPHNTTRCQRGIAV